MEYDLHISAFLVNKNDGILFLFSTPASRAFSWLAFNQCWPMLQSFFNNSPGSMKPWQEVAISSALRYIGRVNPGSELVSNLNSHYTTTCPKMVTPWYSTLPIFCTNWGSGGTWALSRGGRRWQASKCPGHFAELPQA